MQRPTLKDVAQKAGVSVTTASFAINDVKGRVSEDNRKLILACARELNYVPDSRAKSLRTQENNTVMLVYGEEFLHERNASTMQLVASAIKYANEQGKDILMRTINDLNPNYDNEIEKYLNYWNSRRVEGIIFHSNCDDHRSTNFYKQLYDSGIDLVTISHNKNADMYPSVFLDDYKIMGNLVSYILQRNYDEIYFVTRKIAVSSHRERGYIDALKKQKAAGCPLYYHSIYRTQTDLWQTIKGVLGRGARVAFACWNDVDAVNILEVLKDNNVKVPEEAGVVGFDDLPSAMYCRPKLTTVLQPFDEMAKNALDILANANSKPGKSNKISVEVSGEIIARESL